VEKTRGKKSRGTVPLNSIEAKKAYSLKNKK
jgi:hypothetical protein